MTALFTLDGAVARDPAIEVWIDSQPIELARIARQWFEHLRRCGSDVRARMHDECPTACVGGAAFAYVNAFRAHVNLGFFHGADLPDPARLLEGTGKQMRHVKLRPGAVIDTGAVEALVAAPYRDLVARLDPTR
jgi:hypothetical protein